MTVKKCYHFASRAPFMQLCPCLRLGTTAGTRARLEKFPVASASFRGYRLFVAVNPVIELGRSWNVRRNSAPITIAGAFFVPAFLCYGGLRGDTYGCAGFLTSRSANPAQPVTLSRLAAKGGSSSTLGAVPMLNRLFSLTPSEIQNKAKRHRARAIAQLSKKSSLKVRHERYNAEMTRARFFEAMLAGGVQ
ncbi:hypothetical protein D3C84_319280 [compost metagenome]